MIDKNCIDEIRERSKTDIHTEQTWEDIAYLLRIAEAAEVMQESLIAIEKHDCCVMHNDESCPGCNAKEALAKAKELMGE